jgi:hypothetical protein
MYMVEKNKDIVSDEVIAVISAVIAAMSTRPGHRLVVKSVIRIPQTSPVWNSTGRVERLRRNLNS